MGGESDCCVMFQVLLKASAGMDYWEFAQFIVTVALPRLQCLMALPDSWTVLKQFIQRVSSKDSQHTITFFKNGSFPCDLSCSPLSDVDVVSCLDARTNFKEFLGVFPVDVKQLLEQVTSDCSSGVVYRVFELYVLSSVAKELNKTLETLKQ